MSAGTNGLPESLDVSFLPQDLFLMILGYLEPPDVVRCRRVCKSWHDAFGNPSNLILLLKRWYPLAKEVRELQGKGAFDNLDKISEDDHYWCRIFDQVTARYDHLARGKPRSVRKFKLCRDFPLCSRQWFQVQSWDSHKSHLNERVDLPFNQTFWTYEDGLLVYPSEDLRSLLLMDLETDATFTVPFSISGKVIRRIRLQEKLLVVEWAEPNAFHWLNDSDGVHRHFASSFDIQRAEGGWNITFRNEWKIMFLGHPLSERDRFFSSHNNTHYTIYAWQPNRSLYTADEDAPIESLFVWDISEPSSYRPSLDPTGRLKDDDRDEGPSIVARFSFRELGFYSVRQRGCPKIMKLDVNSEAGTVDITENTCTGPRNRNVSPLEWISEVQTTSIPFHGYGPCWRRNADLVLPPYRGNSGMQTAPLTSGCPWYAEVSEATDEQAEVKFCLRLHAVNTNGLMGLVLTIRTPHSCITLNHTESSEISYKGRVCGDERYVIGENFDHELVIFRFDR